MNVDRYWTDYACPTLGKNNNGRWDPKARRYGVRCCGSLSNGKDSETCTVSSNLTRNIMTYDEAKSKCAEMGYRLCTVNDLLDGMCCKVEGGDSRLRIWTSTIENPYPGVLIYSIRKV